MVYEVVPDKGFKSNSIPMLLPHWNEGCKGAFSQPEQQQQTLETCSELFSTLADWNMILEAELQDIYSTHAKEPKP